MECDPKIRHGPVKGTVVAKDMGDVGTCELSHRTGWLALGVGGRVWLVSLRYQPNTGRLVEVFHSPTMDCHTTTITSLYMYNRQSLLVTVGEEATVTL